MSLVQSQYSYQVGGSLSPHASCYVERQADGQLFRALTQGEFCYVFNSRQMGKSSLRVRITQRLRDAGRHCGVIDITEIGSQNLTPDQWYASVVLCLANRFNLAIKLGDWWRDRLYLSPIKRLGEFVDQVLLTQVDGDIVLFIDEIDSVLGLDFPVEDFFALMRSWYNQRPESPNYRRLTLALFGVATPSELIADYQRTPFNVGKAIALDGFQLHDAQPLLPGLATICPNPEAILTRILHWTGGQPFLTQKLCQLMLDGVATPQPPLSTMPYIAHGLDTELGSENLSAPPSPMAKTVDKLVEARILTNWEAQDEPEHLKTIRDYLLNNEYRAGRLLGLYQRILEQDSIPLDDSPEQMELLLSGLVMKSEGQLTLRNRIYRKIFNPDWVNQQLSQLRPYASALTAWLQSDCRDESRLLRGRSLQDAQVWSSFHSLSDADYQFLTASQQLEQQQTQQRLKAEKLQAIEAQLVAEAARVQATEARLVAETNSAKRQRWFLMAVSIGLVLTSALGLTTVLQYRRAIGNQRQAELREVEAIATSAGALFASQQTLDARIEAVRAMRTLQTLPHATPELQFKVTQVLRHISLSGLELNRFSGHQTSVNDVAIHPNNHLIASASADGTIKLWHNDGSLLKTLNDHNGIVLSVVFSPDGALMASGSYDRTVKLWTPDGTLIRAWDGHGDDVTSVAFSPDSQFIASASVDTTIKIWTVDGVLLQTMRAHNHPVRRVIFSPDGQFLASISDDKSVKLWRTDGSLVRTIEENGLTLSGVTFSPDGQLIATSSPDNIKLWTLDGTLVQTLEGGGKLVTFSPDAQRIAAVKDGAIRFWHRDGTPLPKLSLPITHHPSALEFSADGQYLVSAAGDRTLRLWQLSELPWHTLGHPRLTHNITFSPDGETIATAGWDHTVRLWQSSGELLHIFRGHGGDADYQGRINDVAFSPDGQRLASGGADNRVKIWHVDGTLLSTLDIGGDSQVYATRFSPDGEQLLTISWGGPIELWQADGTRVKTLDGSDRNGGRGAFSPDGQLIAAPLGQGDVLQLWQRDGTLLQTFSGHEGWVTQVVFSPDGQYLASAGADQTIRIWTLDGELLRTIEAHEDVIKALAVSPDGQLLASGGRDEVVKLWRWDGTLVATVPQPHLVWGIAFHPDGNRLAWTGLNRATLLNDLPLILDADRLLEHNCRQLRDYLRTGADVNAGDRQLCQGIDGSN